MHYYNIAPNQIVRSGCDFFTYSSESPLEIGQIVKIEIGKKQMIGVVLEETKRPIYETKNAIPLENIKPLPKQLVKLSNWISEYYVTPLASVLQTILPSGIQKSRQKKEYLQRNIVKRDRTNIVFNNEQALVINTLDEHSNGTFILQGITGSGKTEVYIDTAKKAINNDKSVIMLVPEIALTSQLVSEFSKNFENIIVTHSKMTESQRHIVWNEISNSDKPLVIIGPRSALFMPLYNIGSIIVDEAHEPSYKQDQSPKYSALRVATVLGKLHNAKVIFGSATPNISDRFLADQTIDHVIRLTTLAKKDAIPATVETVDMKNRNNFKKHRFLSDQLLNDIENTIKNDGQVLIFHNRRGSTTTTLCKNCGHIINCPKCYIPLTLHADRNSLDCHICSHQEKSPTSCPVCHSADIIFKGIGTKLIESELNKLFPKANVARFDGDNKTGESVDSKYDEIYDGTIQIIIGTQVVAKGLDLPKLKTVGIIQADAGLAIPDFNTNERVFQLLAQVIGRVGRNKNETKVFVQTYQPDNQVIINGTKQDYESFYNSAIAERKKSFFPPFTHLLKLTCSYKTEEIAIKNSKQLTNELRKKLNKDVQVLGPAPAFYERQNGNYRWQIILKSPRREYLIDAIKLIPNKYWQFDIDPTSLL